MGVALAPWPSQGGALSAVVVTSENSAEFYASRLGLDAPEPAAAAEVAEPAVESAAKTEPGTAEAEASEQHAEATDSQAKSKVHLRFSELTEQRKQAEAEAAKARDDAKAARERADLAETGSGALRAKYEPPKPDELGPEPTREQFSSDQDFALALKDWAGEAAIRDRDQKDAAAKIERAWNERQTASSRRNCRTTMPWSLRREPCGLQSSAGCHCRKRCGARKSCITSRRTPTWSKSSSA
jgi:hypothetical protein